MFLKNHIRLVMVALLTGSLLTGCDSGKGGGSDSPTGGNGPNKIDFNVPIDAEACHDPFMFVSDYQEKLEALIGFGDAPCVKKALSLGAKATEKVPTGSHFDRKYAWPVHVALNESALFFASSGMNQKGFEVLKVLVEAGADLNAKNDEGQTVLQASLTSEILSKYPNAPKYIIQSGKADLEAKDGSGNTSLLNLLLQKNKDFSEFIVANGASVQARTRAGATSLQIAMDDQFEDLAMILLNKGVDPTVIDNQGNNALQSAAANKMTNLTTALLAKDVELNHQNNSRETALLIALKNNASEIAKKLITKGADVNMASNNEAPIHAALRNQNDELSEILIPMIKDVNVRDSNKSTPLILATRYASPRHITSLLARGAKADLEDNSEMTALMYALSNGEATKTAELLKISNVNQEGPDGKTALYFAQSVPDVQSLMNAHADINHKSQTGETPLSSSLQNSQKEVSLYLINQGADINWADASRTTLLHRAIAGDDLQSAQALIQRGADVRASDIRGRTPLFNVQSGAAVDLLAKNQADLNRMDSNHRMVLVEAAQNYLMQAFAQEARWAIIDRLLENGANPNAQDEHGFTALHFAAKSTELPDRFLKLISGLIAHKANVNAADNSGNTALHYVMTEAAASLIVAAGPNLNLKNQQGATAKDLHVTKLAHLQSSLTVLDQQIKSLEDTLKTQTPGSYEYQQTQNSLNSTKQDRQKTADLAAAEGRIVALL